MSRKDGWPLRELHFRCDYAHSAEGRSELAKLIYDVFGLDVSPLNRWGHDPSVVSFGWWRDRELVANVSLFERCLLLSGKTVAAFGVQSVAVRPQWRGKNLFRDLLGRALEYADARRDLVVLGTGTPSLYAPFGFRQVQECKFTGKQSPKRSKPKCRPLSLSDDQDVALILDLFARRSPTSFVAAVCDHPALFLLKAVESPKIELIYLPGVDALVAIRASRKFGLSLLDIVAPVIPTLEEIVAGLGYDGERIEVCVTPDRLSWAPEKKMPIDNGHMVRGPFLPAGVAFMLSDMSI